MKITIGMKMLAGNMGDGWKNNNDAVKAYAEFYESRIREELAEATDGHDLSIDIDAVEDTSGDSGEIVVTADSDDEDRDAEFEMIQQIENELQMLDFWSEFCGSDDFSHL